MTKKIPLLAVALLTAAACSLGVLAAPPTEPASAYFVNDFANVLSDETQTAIVDAGTRLSNTQDIEAVLVTVDFTDGMDIADYALELANGWGIGNADGRGRGLLILMSIGGKDYYTLQGFGLEETLPSGDIFALLDEHMEADFAAGNFDAAALNTYQAFVQRLGGSVAGAANGSGAAAGVTDERYVYDEAGVLDAATVRYLTNLAEDTRDRVGAAVTVAVRSSTGGRDIEDFAYDVFADRGLDGNSVLVLMTVREDAFYVLPGEHVADAIREKEFNKGFGKWTDYAAGDYNAPAKQAAEVLSNQLVQNLSTAGGYAPAADPYRTTAYVGPSWGVIFSSLLMIVVLVSLLTVLPRRRRYRRYYGVPFNPFARRYVRRYGPGGYWGPFGGPRPGFHAHPPPRHHGGHPPGGGFGGGGNRPVGGGPSSKGGFGSSGGRSSSGGGFGSSSGGFRGGGGGRSSGGFSGGGSRGGGSFGGGSRGGGGFSGGSRGGGGGGGFRGGGGGRR